jgi:hypothetical protein
MSKYQDDINSELDEMIELAWRNSDQTDRDSRRMLIYKLGYLLGFISRLAWNDSSIRVAIRHRIRYLLDEIKYKNKK